MKVFSFLIYYFFLIPLSLLPYRALYLLSDFIYFVLYVIFKYRRTIVRKNITNSFPEYSESRITEIEKKFYSHFCDIIVESIKLFTISEKQLSKRLIYKNREEIEEFYRKNKSVVLCGGHYNNWEMFGTIIQQYIQHKVIGIYAPLNNSFFNSKFIESRSKFGLSLLSMKKVKEGFEENKKLITATVFATDQSPTYSKNVHWTMFLNQPTAVFTGAEFYAKAYNYPVIFGYITKVKRGYYELSSELICENPNSTKDGEITELHTRMLEKQILENPQFWLWTHNRWKRKITEKDILYKN